MSEEIDSAGAVTSRVTVPVAGRPLASVASTVTGKVPSSREAPSIRPVPESESPSGNVPDTTRHEYGAVPFSVSSCNACVTVAVISTSTPVTV